MTDIFCRGCEQLLGSVAGDTDDEIRKRSAELRAKLDGRCPKCGRELWSEAEKHKVLQAIPLRLLT